jgi:hypothetical protein
MSRTQKREHGPAIKPKRGARLLRRRKQIDDKVSTAADLAVDGMAAAIGNELELEEIVHEARPHLRDRVRERLIPHLSFEVRPKIVRP